MHMRTTLTATATAAVLIVMSGCAVTRGQESVGAYVDDTAITTAVKASFVDNKEVDATSISVETLNGTVMLSGFAKSGAERTTAENLTRKVGGVRSIKNEIAVRP
jgi:hyperosmotically inducible periplasmic protein